MKKNLSLILLSLVILIAGLSLIGSITGSTVNIHVETDINAPAEEAWDILGRQFADIDKWSSTVESSRIPGQEEIPEGLVPASEAPVPGRITVSKVVEATEILVDYSEQQREFTFRATGFPSFMVSYMANTSKLFERGPAKSTVVFDAELRFTAPFFFMKPIMQSRMTSMFGVLQGELKTYVETGKIAVTAE